MEFYMTPGAEMKFIAAEIEQEVRVYTACRLLDELRDDSEVIEGRPREQYEAWSQESTVTVQSSDLVQKEDVQPRPKKLTFEAPNIRACNLDLAALFTSGLITSCAQGFLKTIWNGVNLFIPVVLAVVANSLGGVVV